MDPSLLHTNVQAENEKCPHEAHCLAKPNGPHRHRVFHFPQGKVAERGVPLRGAGPHVGLFVMRKIGLFQQLFVEK